MQEEYATFGTVTKPPSFSFLRPLFSSLKEIEERGIYIEMYLSDIGNFGLGVRCDECTRKKLYMPHAHIRLPPF